MNEASGNEPLRGGASPYRETTATLGELRTVYVPRGRLLWIGHAVLGFLGLLIGLVLLADLAKLGSLAAIGADLAKLGDSELLGVLLMSLVLIPVAWAVRRLRRVHRHQRVRFHDLGLELVGPDAVAQQCRYDEIVEITRVDLGRGLEALRIERTGGAPWVIPPMFETSAIAAHLAVMQRHRR